MINFLGEDHKIKLSFAVMSSIEDSLGMGFMAILAACNFKEGEVCRLTLADCANFIKELLPEIKASDVEDEVCYQGIDNIRYLMIGVVRTACFGGKSVEKIKADEDKGGDEKKSP